MDNPKFGGTSGYFTHWTYDFSTLDTPHDKLKAKLTDIITRAFKGMNKKYIRVTYSAKWTVKRGESSFD